MQNPAMAAPLPATEPAFELVLARSHLRLPVEPGESMADVLQLAGIAIDTLCEQACAAPAPRAGWLAHPTTATVA